MLGKIDDLLTFWNITCNIFKIFCSRPHVDSFFIDLKINSR